MSLFAGTGSLIRLALRRDRVRLPIWILLLAVLPVITAASFAELYPEAAAREQIALTLGSSPAINVLLGPLYSPSIGGLTAWRLAVPASLLVALMSAFTVVRHTRGEEEAGRSDLLGANVVGRRAPLTAALIVASGAGVVAAALSVGRPGCGRPADLRCPRLRIGHGGRRNRVRRRSRGRRSAVAGFVGRTRGGGRGTRGKLHVARRRGQHL